MEALWIALILGSACCVGGGYFYCTRRRQRCYEDSEVPEVQISR